MTYKLVLLRHGQSAWNKTNQFTGWVDVPLTEQGVEEAKNGGRLLKEKNVLPDIVFTSMLRRAINTANVALDEADRLWIPVKRSWRLNERHYGALQGKNKTEIRQEYGDEKFMLWRRSYATPPPEIDPNDEYAQNNDPRYTGDPVPEAECLADVVKRVEPYFKSDIEPELKAGKTVLIAAHGNSCCPPSFLLFSENSRFSRFFPKVPDRLLRRISKYLYSSSSGNARNAWFHSVFLFSPHST